MGKPRYAANTDKNESPIVKALRKVPGVTVETGHDDILVGYKDDTYWFEIKNPDRATKKDGTTKRGELKPSQVRLLREFTGHYRVVTTLDEILAEIGVIA